MTTTATAQGGGRRWPAAWRSAWSPPRARTTTTTTTPASSDSGGRASDLERHDRHHVRPRGRDRAQGLQDAFDEFTEETGITIEVLGRPQLRGADRHPGRRRQPARHRHVPAAGQGHATSPGRPHRPARRRRRPRWRRTSTPASPTWSTIDGELYGIPAKADLKSLVWYSPAAFEERRLRGPRDVRGHRWRSPTR